jgi:hypothetical protein
MRVANQNLWKVFFASAEKRSTQGPPYDIMTFSLSTLGGRKQPWRHKSFWTKSPKWDSREGGAVKFLTEFWIFTFFEEITLSNTQILCGSA